MNTKTRIALAAALVLSSVPAAHAANVFANADRDRGFTTYQEAASAQQPRGQYAPRGQLIEGRNVGVGVQAPVPSDQRHWYERNPIDFNS